MDLTSFQPCMDTSDWLQGTFHEESPVESGSPPGEMISCSRPAALLERRLRPQQEQALKCPRCDSTHTKFCYYNNYSLSQPRYFCKTCRRYWTKGGSLRNVPVGGGCRKNKKTAAAAGKKATEQPPNQFLRPPPHDPTDLHLSFSGLHFPHLNSLLVHPNNPTECKYDQMQWNPRNGDSAAGDSKLDYAMGNPRNYSFMGSNEQLGQMGGLGEMSHEQFLGFPLDGFHGERLLLPFGGASADHQDPNEVETKPSNSRLLSLEWNDIQQGKDSYGYLMNGVGSWSGVINGYGSSTTNPLV